ncbi:MAG: YunC family protein [Victivallaceae bacterium]
MNIIKIDGVEFRADAIAMPRASLLVIQGQNGMLGCGYLNLETAEKLHHALAIVTGVASYDDMLAAKVAKVSTAAAALGVTTGMTGREALLKMG